VVKADEGFTTNFNNGVRINSAYSAETINLSALISLRKRLNDFSNSFDNTELTALLSVKKEDLTNDQKLIIDNEITQTVSKLTTFQKNENIKWWSEKKSYVNASIYVITGSAIKADYVEGEIKQNDSTYIYLRDQEQHTFKWNKGDGTEKSITLSNFVKSAYTVNTEGLSTIGSEKPSDMSDADFQTGTGLNESKSKALKEASTHEGDFDAINTYDNAKISFGFIQFAGNNNSIEYLFARIKLEKPTIFEEYFSQYGVDVEFKTNANDKVVSDSCRIIVHDPNEGKTLRGVGAEVFMSKSSIYAAIMIRAGANAEIKKMQLKIAKENYIDTSEKIKLGFKVQSVKVAEGGLNGPKDIIGETDVNNYKETTAYTINNTNGYIIEIDLDLTNVKFHEILESEKELAALYGTYINTPNISITSFREAIRSIIIEDGLTTIQQVKDIDPIKLLKKAKELNSSSIHKNRIQAAIDEEELND